MAFRLRTRFKAPTGIGVGGGFSVTPSAVSISPATAEIEEGATQQLSASVTNAAAAVLYGPQTNIDYTTSDPAVATVSASGLVTAVAEGACVITGTLRGTNISDTVAVTVVEAP